LGQFGELTADYRAGVITDGHTAQETIFYDATMWQCNPSVLRERLLEREIDARRNPLVQVVGLDNYEAAGGGIRRDLFADDDSGVYLTDAALLESLAQDRLAAIADEVHAEGWSWVDVAPTATYADLYSFQRAPQQQREPTEEEAVRMAALQTKLDTLAKAIDAALDYGDEGSQKFSN